MFQDFQRVGVVLPAPATRGGVDAEVFGGVLQHLFNILSRSAFVPRATKGFSLPSSSMALTV